MPLLDWIWVALISLAIGVTLTWFANRIADCMEAADDAAFKEARKRWFRESPGVQASIALSKEALEYYRRRDDETNRENDHV